MLSFGRGGGNGHSASTPKKLCDWWVRYLTPEEGTVIDPFFGSGTVGVVARESGRKFVGIESERKWWWRCRKRLARLM